MKLKEREREKNNRDKHECNIQNNNKKKREREEDERRKNPVVNPPTHENVIEANTHKRRHKFSKKKNKSQRTFEENIDRTDRLSGFAVAHMFGQGGKHFSTEKVKAASRLISLSRC